MLRTAVIIPLFNGAPWIERTLASVMGQSRRAAEIIVVDDGSRDDGPARTRSFGNVRLLRNPDRGPRTARNYGLLSTQADLVAFLDQDDIWHSQHLDTLAGVLEARPVAVAAASQGVECREEQPWKFPPFVPPEFRAVDPWTNFPFGTIQCPSMVLARRDALLAIGGWNPRTEHVADIELWLRLAACGEFLQSDVATTGIRVHSGSYSGGLRSRHVDRYLKTLRDLATDLALDQIRQHPERQEWFAERLAVADQFHAIGQRFVVADENGFRQAVESLFDLLEQQPLHFRSSALHTLFWFLCPPGIQKPQRQLLTRLYVQWPKPATFGRTILWERMKTWPKGFFFGHWCRRPWVSSRRQLLQAILRTPFSNGASPLLRSGVDVDGWARSDCAVQLPRRRGRCGVRIVIELPGWSGIPTHALAIHAAPHAPLSARLPSGWYNLVVPWRSSDGDLTIHVRCDSVFRLPNDDRNRSFRMVDFSYLDDLASDQVELRPV